MIPAAKISAPDTHAPAPVTSALDLIGRTPVLELTGMFDCGPCRLFTKLESANPGGSIKDRIARTMIEAAEADGRLKPGGTIIEATAGNTGLGLAQVGILKGYGLVLVVPDKMAREKIQHLRGLGVDVRITRSDVGKGHPDYYQDIAQRLADDMPGAVYMNQFSNPANPLAHETTTGPELSNSLAATWTPSWSASAPAARFRGLATTSPASARRPRWCWPIPPARSWSP